MKKPALILVGLVLAGSVGLVSVWFASFRGSASSTGDAVSSAQRYFARAVGGDYDGTYAMLDSASRSAISRDNWQRRNQAALAGTGDLKSAEVVRTEPQGSADAFVTVRLSFEGRDPLEVIVRMVRAEGTWHVHVSDAQPATDGWEHMEP